ncbi:MAG: 30S ribosomal protein S20 [Elusimicrobiota bacterium]|nr:30S ribosomal protein S20 [Elusimicrobiota bacterium]
MAKLKTGRHTSAIKEARQNRKIRTANRKIKTTLKTEIKKYKSAISAKTGESTKNLAGIQSTLDKMAKKKIFARGKSNRLKSRLSALSKKA